MPMHRIHLDKILRDLDVAWAVWPILHSLSVEESEKTRAGIVAAMAAQMRRSASE